jgi:hypothetical protein
MRYFVDLTGTQGDREDQVIKLIFAAKSDFSYDSSTFCAIDGAVKVNGIDPASLSAISSEVERDEMDKFVLDQLRHVTANLPSGESLTVCSFRSVVQYHTLNDELFEEGRLKFLDLREVFHNVNTNFEPLVAWQDSFMPLADAVKYLVRALKEAGGSERKTNLRGRLAKLNSKFAKDGTGSFSNTPKFISILVSAAQEKNLVHSEGVGPNPNIVLTGNGKVQGQWQELETSKLESSINQDDARDSDRYLTLLRSKGFGPFQEVREAVYDAMEGILDSGAKVTIRDLLYGAVDRVRQDVEEAQQTGRHHLLFDPSRGYPWSRVRSFMSVLLTRCLVLKSGDDLVGATWTELKREVTSFELNWRTRLDSEFIVFLLENGCVINMHTAEDLSGAIYNTRRPSGTEKVEECISYLISEAHRCVVSGHESKLTLAS